MQVNKREMERDAKKERKLKWCQRTCWKGSKEKERQTGSLGRGKRALKDNWKGCPKKRGCPEKVIGEKRLQIKSKCQRGKGSEERRRCPKR